MMRVQKYKQIPQFQYFFREILWELCKWLIEKGVGCWVLGSRVKGLGFKVQGSRLKVKDKLRFATIYLLLLLTSYISHLTSQISHLENRVRDGSAKPAATK